MRWEYRVAVLWDRFPDPASRMNDGGDASGLLDAFGAEGWELVCVVPQRDPEDSSQVRNVAYLKRPATHD